MLDDPLAKNILRVGVLPEPDDANFLTQVLYESHRCTSQRCGVSQRQTLRYRVLNHCLFVSGYLSFQFLTEQSVEGGLSLRVETGRVDLSPFKCVVDQV